MVDQREVFCAVLYLMRTGGQWRFLSGWLIGLEAAANNCRQQTALEEGMMQEEVAITEERLLAGSA